jgi:predicted nuclease of predicted toxin-antitoxin system
MANVKFYTDEHIAKAVVKGLRARGIDAVTSAEAKMLASSDEQQLAFARQEGRVIVTYDNDFLKLHTDGIAHAGIAFASTPCPLAI